MYPHALLIINYVNQDASLRTPARKAPTTLLGHVRTPFLIASASPAHAAPKHPFVGPTAELWDAYITSQIKKARYGASETIKQQARHRLSLAQWSIADPAIATIPQVTSGALTYREVLARTRLPVISASVVSQLNDPERAWAIPALAAQRSVCLSRAWWPFDPCVTLPLGLVTGIVTLLTLDTASADLDTAEDDERSLAINLLKLIVTYLAHGDWQVSQERYHRFEHGFTRSDIDITASSRVCGRHRVPLLVSEFQADTSTSVHKDFVKCPAQAVSDTRALLEFIPRHRVSAVKTHLLLGSGRFLQFEVLQAVCLPPACDTAPRDNGVFWVLDANGPSFDLRFGPEGNAARLVSALRMAQYFRDVVIPDAEALLSQLLVPLGETPEHTLPALPHDPPTSRQCGQFTPVGKRNVPAHAEPAE
ncbi:hypothetical protein HDU90_003417 [Geranomyces variabilis]|nr:hypothetical protein HDU90_003417 [Geranomyces variabilis]